MKYCVLILWRVKEAKLHCEWVMWYTMQPFDDLVMRLKRSYKVEQWEARHVKVLHLGLRWCCIIQ